MRYLLVFLLALYAAGCSDRAVPGTTRAADGVALYYRAVGHGRDTVVVLHDGPGLHGAYLVDALEPLSSRATFLIYDLRGRGHSRADLDTSVLSLAQDVADLEDIREAHRLRSLSLIGHGWGAGVAAQYARQHPTTVRRMLFISPMFPRIDHVFGMVSLPYGTADSLGLEGLDGARVARLGTTEPEVFCRRYWGAWLSPGTVRDERTLRRLSGPMCDAPREALSRVDAVNRAMMAHLGSWDWRRTLADVHSPVLVVQGGLAPRPNQPTGIAVWRTAAREWTEALPNSGVVFLDAQPRFPWLDDPGGFHRAAATFLAGNWPPQVLASRSRS